LREGVGVCLGLTLLAFCQPATSPTSGTFSIVAFDPKTGDLGVAVASRVLAVGAVVPYAQAGVGAIATQAFANTTYGPKGLALLRKGLTPEQVLKRLLAEDKDREQRQVGIVDAKGKGNRLHGQKVPALGGASRRERLRRSGQHLGGRTGCQGDGASL
jgi:uncharacterized Ntn-hydrolase superfamily protein